MDDAGNAEGEFLADFVGLVVALLLGDGPGGLVALGVGLLAAVGLLVAAIVGAAGLLGGVVAITAAVIIATRAIILFAFAK